MVIWVNMSPTLRHYSLSIWAISPTSLLGPPRPKSPNIRTLCCVTDPSATSLLHSAFSFLGCSRPSSKPCLWFSGWIMKWVHLQMVIGAAAVTVVIMFWTFTLSVVTTLVLKTPFSSRRKPWLIEFSEWNPSLFLFII